MVKTRGGTSEPALPGKIVGGMGTAGGGWSGGTLRVGSTLALSASGGTGGASRERSLAKGSATSCRTASLARDGRSRTRTCPGPPGRPSAAKVVAPATTSDTSPPCAAAFAPPAPAITATRGSGAKGCAKCPTRPSRTPSRAALAAAAGPLSASLAAPGAAMPNIGPSSFIEVMYSAIIRGDAPRPWLILAQTVFGASCSPGAVAAASRSKSSANFVQRATPSSVPLAPAIMRPTLAIE